MTREPSVEQHAREMFGLPDDWRSYKWKAIGVPPKFFGSQLTGAVCREMFSRGPRKGTPAWAKRDRSTECTVTITNAKHAEWLLAWESDTGKCSRCAGTGETMASWHYQTGVKMRACEKCGGAGLAKVLQESV